MPYNSAAASSTWASTAARPASSPAAAYLEIQFNDVAVLAAVVISVVIGF
jgi:hypothetical protein